MNEINAKPQQQQQQPEVTNLDINPLGESKFFLPFAAVGYFIAHPSLWGAVLLPLCFGLCLNLILVIVFLAAAFPVQAILLTKTSLPGWAAWLIAFVISLCEILLSLLITYAVCLQQFCDRLQFKTLEIEGIKIKEGADCCAMCAMDLWMNMFMLIIFILTLPLHFIPIIGTIAFCYINGLFLAWGCQQPYFHAFGVPWQKQWNNWVAPNKSDYFAFGFSAQLLNLIPVVNFLFIFTNFVAGAIWIANEHKTRIKMQQGGSSFVSVVNTSTTPNAPLLL